jgi:carboxyl-terminal processing protease
VKNEIAKLKKENVDGLILDLRDNGGGSLEDAVNMAGLFIEKGPIVQVKSRFGQPQMLEDRDPSLFYDGPLVVMVNSLSASASEILAAAMQDYKRGIVMGSESTYGKGTVQRMMSLDDYVASENDNLKPLGSIKVTIQKFYRINGGATQLKGVVPDIIFPDKYSYIDMGEKEQDYPMPWNEISPAKYTKWEKTDPNIEKIKKASRSRIEHNAVFKLIDEEGQRLKKQMDDSKYSLNLQNFRAEQKKLRAEAKKYEEIEKEISGFSAELSHADAPSSVADTLSEIKTKSFLKTLRKDAYLFEAFNVISDTEYKRTGSLGVTEK